MPLGQSFAWLELASEWTRAKSFSFVYSLPIGALSKYLDLMHLLKATGRIFPSWEKPHPGACGSLTPPRFDAKAFDYLLAECAFARQVDFTPTSRMLNKSLVNDFLLHSGARHPIDSGEMLPQQGVEEESTDRG